MNLFSDLSTLLSALKASPFNMKAVWKAFVKVLNDVDSFIGDTPQMFGTKEGEDCTDLCNQIVAECNKVSGPAVGKDGKWLKIIADIVLKFLPLILLNPGDEQPQG